jgi:hypothetical protein
MKAPVVGVVDASASIGPNPLKELPTSHPHRPQTRGQFGPAVQLAQLIAETVPDFDYRLDAVRGDFHLLWGVENAAIFQ